MSEINITINVDKDGEVTDVRPDQLGTFRHQLDDPDSPVARLHAGKQKKTDIDPSRAPIEPRLGMQHPQTSYLASVSLNPETNLSWSADRLAQTEPQLERQKGVLTDDQMATITRKHEIDAYTCGATSILTPEKTGMTQLEHLQQIERAVHEVMHQIMNGMDILRIPPADVFRLVDTLRDHAFAYASHCASNNTPPCLTTLKGQMMNHSEVQHFVQRHNPGMSWGLEDQYCSRTGKPRNQICTSSISHHGHAHSLEHNGEHHLHGHGHHY